MERRHGRRPSSASTLPDSSDSSTSSDDRHPSTAAPIDLEKGVRSPEKIRKEEKEAGITETEVDLNLAGQRKKFLGIPLPWTGKASPEEQDAAQAATSMKIIDPSPDQMAPFSSTFVPSSLYNLIDPKSISHLESLGGTSGLLEGLRTDPRTGLTEGDEADRKRVFGENRVPSKKPKSFLQLCWAAYTDKVLIILSVAAVVSLALGLYQDLGTPPDTFPSTACPETPGVCTLPQVDWVEGVAITIAILVVVLIGSLNDWQKERQFQKLK